MAGRFAGGDAVVGRFPVGVTAGGRLPGAGVVAGRFPVGATTGVGGPGFCTGSAGSSGSGHGVFGHSTVGHGVTLGLLSALAMITDTSMVAATIPMVANWNRRIRSSDRMVS